MKEQHSGTCIWITGGGSGIGRALALSYSKQGAKVWISGRDLAKLEQVVAEAQGYGAAITPYELDVTDKEACHKAFTEIDSQSVGLDRVILCAGNHIEMPLAEFSHKTCQSLMDVNYYGVTHLLDAILPVFLKRDQGQIGVVASLAGYRGLPVAAAYGASKAALIALTESLRVESVNTGVDIRLINPGFVKSPLTDKNEFEMPFLVEADVAADMIVKGLDTKRFEIRFPRPFSWIMQLLSFLPYGLYMPLVGRLTRS